MFCGRRGATGTRWSTPWSTASWWFDAGATGARGAFGVKRVVKRFCRMVIVGPCSVALSRSLSVCAVDIVAFVLSYLEV